MAEDGDRKRSAASAFGAHADAYRDSDIHRDGDDLDRLAAWCAGAEYGLDVATGAGHTAGALVEAGVDRVVAADAAPRMLATAAASYPAVEAVVADAERLPFATDILDAATCRIAAHHFPDPAAFVAEVARVLEPGGTFAFEDNVAPDESALDTFLNTVERLRDPTHVRSHAVADWLGWLEDAGFAVEATGVVARTLDYGTWLETVDAPPERRERVASAFADPPDGAAEAFEIRRGDDGAVESFANHKLLVRATR
ncbi:class I SAM-dependent methyltransferase [Halobellus ruber]|uniref:Class I SAM-dependent methyltransferase n=1 Tax=Halobellus ruber TaxID=2761102 RepID=A0A7J9SD54_9EURY|nr:class I SAM-dependent methyltransferase [Halobellus ruber]MBB6644854.1 class I SAM-dependent methyltransferase [Halobellus ruber]